MPFSNPIVGGTALIRPAINSPNFVSGATGWSINRNGTAEFSGATIRGELQLGGNGTTGHPGIGVGVSPIPSDLVTYYAGLADPLTIVPGTLTITYDGTSTADYFYDALALDGGTPPNQQAWKVGGGRLNGVVSERYRWLVNPGGALGNPDIVFTPFIGMLINGLLQIGSGGIEVIGGNVTVDNGKLAATSTTPGAIVLQVNVPGDTQPRWSVTRAGSMMGGSGSAAPDVSFTRTSVGIWVSDQIKYNVSGAAETWHGMNGSYAAGWSDHGSGFTVGQYRKCPSPAGVVEVVGMLDTTAPTTTFFTLPAGYRPLATQRIPAWANLTTPVAIDVTNTGTMTPVGATGATQLAFHAFMATDA